MTPTLKNKILKELGDKKPKDERVYYTASFPGLVDLVSNDGEVKFLTSDQEVLSQVILDNFTYQPPPSRGLPPNLRLPRADEVLRYAQNHDVSDASDVSDVCKGCTQLYYDLLDYHKKISELPYEDLYHLLVLWDFHTYLIDKASFSPIIYFYSVAERGKSRTLKGMTYVAYRGLRKGDITDAQLIRDCTHLQATLAFDMMDFWDKIKQAGSIDVILNRYERGMTVSRVNRPDKGAFQDTDYYDVFGPTILATNEIISEIAETRSIPIVMLKADKDFEEEVTMDAALPLKEQLTAFKLAHYKDELPPAKKIVKSRLGDIIRPLHQVLLKVNPKEEKTFEGMAKRIEKIKLVEKIGTTDSEILQAWIKSVGEMVNGVIASQLVTNNYNFDKNDKEKLSSRKIGNRLKSFGFQTTQTTTSALGFFYDDEKTQKLKKEYGVLTPEASEVSESSETSGRQAQNDEKDEEIDPDKLPF